MIKICETCKGQGKVLVDKEGFTKWCCEPKEHDSKTFADFQGPCPACQGKKIIPTIDYISNGTEIKLRRNGESIFGKFEDIVRIKVKPGNGGEGFDLWIDDKKLTRGRKYIPGPLSNAIFQVLKAGEYKYESTAEII